ncbi:MAG: hypothetical protein P1P76_08975 [Anaerolineales bacterium]|nr:hypothetical protein [Anaerolineales bacterium]
MMQALGVSLEEGFARFNELGEEFVNILQNPNAPTGSTDLNKFIDAFSDNGWNGDAITANTQQAEILLSEGKKMIALVTIDVNRNGVVSGSGETNHWVEIREINRDTNEITYYNPYTNEVSEPIVISEFESAWQKASGGEAQTAVTVST